MVACTGAERSFHLTITPGGLRGCLAKAGPAVKRNALIKSKNFSIVLISAPRGRFQQKHLARELVAVVLRTFSGAAGDCDYSTENHTAGPDPTPKDRALRHRSHVLRPAQKQPEQSECRDRNSEPHQSFSGHSGVFRWSFRCVHPRS